MFLGLYFFVNNFIAISMLQNRQTYALCNRTLQGGLFSKYISLLSWKHVPFDINYQIDFEY